MYFLKIKKTIKQKQDIIANGPLDEVLELAKIYNIKEPNSGKLHTTMSNLIKERLIKEGIDIDKLQY